MPQVTALLKEASKLDLPDRAELVSSLREDLDPHPHYVSDEEVLERLEELRPGKVKGLTRNEFWKAVVAHKRCTSSEIQSWQMIFATRRCIMLIFQREYSRHSK